MERRDVRDRSFVRVAREPEGEEELVGAVLGEVAPERGELPGALDRMLDGAERDRMVERVQPELEGGDDAEVRPGAAHAPEELRVLVLGRAHDPAVGGHELDREHVVDREPEPALQPSHAAAERQAADSGVRHDADGADEAECLRRRVELAEQRAASHTRGSRLRVDLGRPGSGDRSITIPSSQVERPGMLWPPQRTAISRSCSRANLSAVDDVVGVGRPDDERRTAVGHPVPDGARLVVTGIVGQDDLPGEPLAEARQSLHGCA